LRLQSSSAGASEVGFGACDDQIETLPLRIPFKPGSKSDAAGGLN
jgi:hypothetical protein